jgi:hypothetical protein
LKIRKSLLLAWNSLVSHHSGRRIRRPSVRPRSGLAFLGFEPGWSCQYAASGIGCGSIVTPLMLPTTSPGHASVVVDEPVVQEPVEDRRGEHVVGERPAPLI